MPTMSETCLCCSSASDQCTVQIGAEYMSMPICAFSISDIQDERPIFVNCTVFCGSSLGLHYMLMGFTYVIASPGYAADSRPPLMQSFSRFWTTADCTAKSKKLSRAFCSHKRRAPVPSLLRKKEPDSDSSVDSDTSDEAKAAEAQAVPANSAARKQLPRRNAEHKRPETEFSRCSSVTETAFFLEGESYEC